MYSILSDFFESPLLDESLLTQRIRALRWVLIFNLGVCLAATCYVLTNDPYTSRDRLVLIFWSIAILAAYFLLQSGKIKLATFCFSLMDWLALTYLAIFVQGSMYSPFIVTIMLIAVAAGLILGRVYGLSLIALGALSLFSLFFIGRTGVSLTLSNPLTPERNLIFQLLNMALISVIIGYTTWLLHTYRQRHSRHQQELAEKHRELEEQKTGLERLVHERTATLLEQKEYFEALMRTSPLAIVALDMQHRVVAINEAFEILFGYTLADAVNQPLDNLVAIPENVGEAQSYTQRTLAGERISGSGVRRRKDGSLIDVEIHGVPVIVDKKQVGILGIYQDITTRKRSEERLQYLATHDLLTELPNRFLFTDRLKQALAKAQRSGQSLAILFLDLDGFKNVNDTFGHMKGDALLKEVSQRLYSCVRKSDTLARLGGDEFAYLIEDIKDIQDVTRISHKILVSLANPFSLDGNPIILTASIGISLFPQDGDNTEALLIKADSAMYQAKDNGGNTSVFSSHHPHSEASW